MPEFNTTLEANKYYKDKLLYNKTLDVILSLWVDLAFKNRDFLISDVGDTKASTFWFEALDAINIERILPLFMMDLMVQGRFAANMVFDEAKGYWTQVVQLDSDYYSLRFSPLGTQPKLALHTTKQEQWWATTNEPRVVEQRVNVDPKLIELLAKGEPIVLEPENTLFMARKAHGTDFYGTSVLANLEEEDYESPERLAYKLHAFHNPLAIELRNDLTEYVVRQKILLPLSRKHNYPMPKVGWTKGGNSYMGIQQKAMEEIGCPLYTEDE